MCRVALRSRWFVSLCFIGRTERHAVCTCSVLYRSMHVQYYPAPRLRQFIKVLTYKRHCLVAFGWLWPSFFLNGQRRLDVSPIVQSIDARSTATDRVPPGRLIDLRKVLHGKIFVPGKLRMRSTSLAKLNNQALPRTYFVTRLTLPEASERSWGGSGAALRRDYTRMDVIQSRRSSWNGKNNNVTFR
jgi:hypothetical protein